MAEQLTQEQIDRHYDAMQDSVAVINEVVAEPSPYLDTLDRLRANVDHLTIMRAKDFWTTEDFTDVDAAIDAGTARIAEVEASGVVRPREVAEVKTQLHAAAKSAYSRAMAPIATQYPAEEREGWAEQVTAAQEVLSGGQNDLIDALRAPTGETAQAMAQNIIDKRTQYLISYGQVTAARRGLAAQIEAATTLEDLDAIDVAAAFGLA